MPPHDPSQLPSRRRRPVVEGLESRDLPAAHPIGPPLPGRHIAARHVHQFVPLLYAPGTPQPTAQEVRRESFVNVSIGHYTVGPGHFQDQALTIKGFGKNGRSNLQFRDRFQFLIFEPKDPAQPVTGVINYLSASFLSNSATIILDLNGPTGTEVHGLPTHLSWTHDSASGTPFTGAGTLPIFNGTAPIPGTGTTTPPTIVDFNLGAGVTDFHFIPDPHPRPGTLGSGRLVFVSRGLLNGSGALNAADKNYS